ncbi:hypothetical protein CK203_071768 [Vitis vinifera]|uniref:Uncharacterized protein n=1 Tax=Vitis vinifera TaxID=29760 RepID=A0A438C370_VITVI|nr:hypothetical protein CK203_071768 [Vitis vinifera]
MPRDSSWRVLRLILNRVFPPCFHLIHENYDQLNKAFAGTDHSWTALTLKLCTALQTANTLVQSTNTKVELLSEKVGELERVVKRGDSAVAAAKAIHISLNQKDH